MTDNNISALPPITKAPDQGGKQFVPHYIKKQTEAVKTTATPAIRQIAPITEYNAETGTIEPKAEQPYGVSKKEVDAKVEPDKVKAETADRHSAWKEEQAQKKQQQADQKLAKAVKQQALAKDLLLKGDLVGASKALDMSPADFATYVDNARLSIPTKTEELSPEQKRAKDEEQFRADRLAFEKEQSAFRYQTIASNYIRDNIAPVLQDKDKFELIHTAGLNDMQNYIYEFMNKHYNETKEVLSAQDVAETIENQLYQNSIQAIEANRKVKKLAKLFASQEEEVKVAVDEMAEAPGRQTRPSFVEPTLTNKQARPLDTRFPTRDEELNASSEEEAEEAEPNTNTVSKRKSVGSDIPFALLSRAERLARMKAEQR